MLKEEFAPLQIVKHPARLRICGNWTLAHYTMLKQAIGDIQVPLSADMVVDFDELGILDTAGAELLAGLLGAERLYTLVKTDLSLSTERRALLQVVSAALRHYHDEPTAVWQRSGAIVETLNHIGFTVTHLGQQTLQLLAFMGLTLETLAGNLFFPRRWRVTSLIVHIEQTGLNAVPIIALLSFLVGAVVAFLGKSILSGFGASIYTVNLVAFSFLREFGVLLTAILIAGRTASAFTAQIGSMKANEEIDAMRTIGLNPMELLVLPRVLALLLTLPMLTFIAMLSGIVGGGVVCALVLAISPTMFLTILQDTIPVRHFFIGMSKAPVFAFLIAVIGCLEGFKVKSSAQSLGQHTTSSVVQSIFVVILLDAVAALFFMELDW